PRAVPRLRVLEPGAPPRRRQPRLLPRHPGRAGRGQAALGGAVSTAAPPPEPAPEIDLGVPGLAPLPELAEAEARWLALAQKLAPRRFLHSEGFSTPLGTPQRVSADLALRCAELVARFNRFYEGTIHAYYDGRAPREEYLYNALFEPPLA